MDCVVCVFWVGCACYVDLVVDVADVDWVGCVGFVDCAHCSDCAYCVDCFRFC